MDDDNIKFMPGDVFQQLPKDRPEVNGIDMGTFTFFPVDTERFPASVFTEFPEESLARNL